MFYISLKTIVEKFPNKLAVNDMTYTELLEKSIQRTYNPICHSDGVDILLDVINASYLNKPIVVLPKINRESAIMPDTLPNTFNVILYSSGSTGAKKPIVLPEQMLMANIKNVIKINEMTHNDKILTVAPLNHTAGITCQTLGGLFIGASLIIETFNPFTLLRLLKDNAITTSHILPLMSEAVMKNHGKINLPHLRLIWTGSDCMTKDQINFWLSPNTNVMITYGMTEAGPPVFYHTFSYSDPLDALDNGFAVGSTACCEVNIVDNELQVRGDIVNVDGWFKTGDCFKHEKGFYYYTGRVNAGGKIVPKGKH